jgi:hypothetical protein
VGRASITFNGASPWVFFIGRAMLDNCLERGTCERVATKMKVCDNSLVLRQ